VVREWIKTSTNPPDNRRFGRVLIFQESVRFVRKSLQKFSPKIENPALFHTPPMLIVYQG
jgi:hypothetical protein